MQSFKMRNFWLIVIVSILVSLPILATDIYVSSLPVIQVALHTNEYLMKLSLNIYMIGFAITTLLAGILSDVISKYKILLVGLLIFCLSSFVIGYFQNIDALILGRLFQGLGSGVGTVIARLILKERINAHHGLTQLKALSIVGASMSLSPLIGPILGASLTQFFSWDGIFYFLAVIAKLLFVSVLYLSKSAHSSFPKHSIHPKVLIQKYTSALKMSAFLFPTLAISLVCAAEFIFISNSAFFYQNVMHLSAFEYSIFLSCVLSGFLLGSYSLDIFSKKYPVHRILKRTIQICSLFTLLPLVGWWFGELYSAVFLGVSMIAVMAGLGVVISLTQSIALNISKGKGASIAGLFLFIEFLAIALSGYIVSLFPYSGLPMIAGIMVCWILLRLIEIYMNGEAVLNIR